MHKNSDTYEETYIVTACESYMNYVKTLSKYQSWLINYEYCIYKPVKLFKWYKRIKHRYAYR